MSKHLLFLLNSIIAAVLLLLYAASFVPPSNIPLFPSLTLATPVIIAANLLFVVIWAVKLEKRILLSVITLLICYPFVLAFYQFQFLNSAKPEGKMSIKILDYNTHHFSGIEDRKKFLKQFDTLVQQEQPDMLFLQEEDTIQLQKWFSKFPYRRATSTSRRKQGANPILSKYPIINAGSVGMDNVHIGRNTLYADIKFGSDTLRCYNVHLTSYRLAQESEKLKKQGAKNIVRRLNAVFKYQEQQTHKLISHMSESPYPIIFCGDFNNMAFSYVYRKIKDAGGLKDTFLEKGGGFGATMRFQYFPTRIDFILVPTHFKVLSHKVIKTKNWSDHRPVIAEIAF